jgi:ubiquinone/menaquinone biosynthesis C-methylase UbiE
VNQDKAASPQPKSEIRNPKFPLVLDVGTGTARIPIEICRRTDRLRITAVDLASQMLDLARRNVAERGCDDFIRLERVDAKWLPYPDSSFDAVISNSIVHHIPQPVRVMREMLRVLRPGGLLFVRDLLRPADAETIARLLSKYAGGTNDHQRQLFDQSLHAALTLDEVRDLLRELGLPVGAVRQTTDRHWTICATN